MLDEDNEDVLINVNIIDDEKAEKNVENKKKKPDYKPYDEPQFDEYGMVGIDCVNKCRVQCKGSLKHYNI